MSRLVFRQQAIDDLNSIWKYTQKFWSEKQADKYYSMIRSACTQISKNPSAGKLYSVISDHLYGWPAGRYIIFYQNASGHKTEIIRILHQRCDLKTKLLEK